MPKAFRSPRAPADSHNSSYYVLTGPGTIFDSRKGTPTLEIKDGMANTILIVETKSDIPWTKPEDIAYDPEKPLPQLGGYYEGGFHVALANGSVHFLPSTIVEKTLRTLITKAGGEPVKSEDTLPPQR
jgi:hypothetical protein